MENLMDYFLLQCEWRKSYKGVSKNKSVESYIELSFFTSHLKFSFLLNYWITFLCNVNEKL